jgi:2-keto-4-pentenoate hydratase/2-oxohepta-3-ene-1,7-dioic acid hydratase in catechol pathway
MKLVKVERDGESGEGMLQGTDVRILGEWRPGPANTAPFTLSRLRLRELERLVGESKEVLPLSSVSLAVPVDPLAKIICAGVNYRDHVGEIKATEPANPVIFTRTVDTLAAHGQEIVRPKVSETLDYEGEIAFVIGRRGRHVPVEDALKFVSGYTCFMDGSVREYQRHALTTGKNFWRSGAMGPWVVTADEIGSRDLQLQTFVDGERRQSAHASQMIFNIPALISYCSRMTWLEPGDVIATGTPGGVGSRKVPPSWLKPGQVVEVEVDAIGRLRNSVVDEA